MSSASAALEEASAVRLAYRTRPIGRTARVLFATGLAYGLGTLVDEGGPASVRDVSTLSEPLFYGPAAIPALKARHGRPLRRPDLERR